jgi:hypothetical protein
MKIASAKAEVFPLKTLSPPKPLQYAPKQPALTILVFIFEYFVAKSCEIIALAENRGGSTKKILPA